MGKKFLFIIKSPFQTLCAYSLIRKLKAEEYDVYLLKDTKNAEMAEDFLKREGVKYILFDRDGGILPIMVRLNKIKARYSTTYVGDYYNLEMFAIALSLTAREGKIKYLDDGTATLLMLPPTNLARHYREKYVIFLFFLNSIRFLKRIRESLYTIYNINSNKWKIEKNDLSYLSLQSNKEKDGCYIIGTNSAKILSKEEYERVLDFTIATIRGKYPEAPIFYCPHRADDFKYDDYLNRNNINLFDTKISVEIDFIGLNLNPLLVIGYSSTALLTIKSIYPSTDVISAEIQTNATFSKHCEQINNFYQKCGIEVIKVLADDKISY